MGHEAVDGATGLWALQPRVQGATERIHHLNLKQRGNKRQRRSRRWAAISTQTKTKLAAGADGTRGGRASESGHGNEKKKKKTQRVEQLNENTVGKLKISTKHQRKKVKKGQCWRQLIAGSASKKKTQQKQRHHQGVTCGEALNHNHHSTHTCTQTHTSAGRVRLMLPLHL